MKGDETRRVKDFMGEATSSTASLYIHTRAESFWRYMLEQGTQSLFSFWPSALGVAVRSLVYAPLMGCGSSMPYMENGVQLMYMNRICLGKGVYIDHGARIHSSIAGVKIGAGSRVMFGAYLCAYVSNPIEGEGIEMGSNCWVGVKSVLASGRGGIYMGDNVLIGPNATIVTGDHDFMDTETPSVDQEYICKPVTIGDNAWIGANAVILGGVTIGERCVVAAGSVVTKDVPPFTVVGGVPAKVIRRIDR
ncbi:MAG: acyltransferase [Nitrospinota bacterium]|nr:acyltransferase [Nitrospinota bacterium]